MDKHKRPTIELFIYCLFFLLALVARLTLLGKTTLTETEASWAYQAWQIWKGVPVETGSLISYLSITEGLFSIFGSSNFAARFWPAFAGSTLIWIPFLSRNKLGRIPAILLAGGLVFDPALVSISRIAGSSMPAMVFLLFSGITFHHNRFAWSMAFLFLGLFSGPAFWLGTVILGLAIILSGSLGILDWKSYFQVRVQKLEGFSPRSFFTKEGEILSLLMILSVGSFFFSRLTGLSAWAGSLPEFFLGWINSSGVSLEKILVALVVSNPLIVIFGGLGILAAWRKNDRVGKLASIWFGVALVLILLYPARQTADLIWVVIPLWVCSAREMIRILQLSDSAWYTNALAGLVGVMFTLNWLTFIGMVFQIRTQQTAFLQGGLIVASLALTIVAMSIVASEWGWPAAKKGVMTGFAAVLFVYSFSTMSQGAFRHARDPRSLWTNYSGSGQMELLTDTIAKVSIAETGRWDSIDGAVFNPTNAMLWSFRDFSQFKYYETFDPGILAPVLVTREIDSLMVTEELYRGQDFVLATKPGWEGVFPPDWISWIGFRAGPLFYDNLVLWVRNDILSGN